VRSASSPTLSGPRGDSGGCFLYLMGGDLVEPAANVVPIGPSASAPGDHGQFRYPIGLDGTP
jgi:hypothetical protein